MNDKILTEGTVSKALASIAVPMLVMMLTAVGFSWLDAWYIAKLGEEELTAIDICFPIITFTSSVIYGGLGTGVSAAVAAYASSSNKNKTAWGIRYAIILAIAISLFITLTIVIFGKTILNHQLPNQPIITDIAYTYCLWYYLPYSLMGIGAVLASSMRGTGNAVRPMIYSLVGMCLNGILTPLFSYESTNQWYSPFFLDMGMKGAALATVFAYVTMAIFLLKDYFYENQGLKRHTKAIASEQAQKIKKRILSASFIAALVPACTNFVIGFSQSMLASRGQFVLDAYSLSRRFEQFLIMLAIPICAANMILISSNLEQQKYNRIREAFKITIVTIATFSTLVSIYMIFDSGFWFGSFTDNQNIFAEGRIYFQYAWLHIVFIPLIIMLNFIFQGLSKPAKPLPYTLTSIFLFQGLGCYVIIQKNLSTKIYYLTITLGTVLAFVICFRIFSSLLKKMEQKNRSLEMAPVSLNK